MTPDEAKSKRCPFVPQPCIAHRCMAWVGKETGKRVVPDPEGNVLINEYPSGPSRRARLIPTIGEGRCSALPKPIQPIPGPWDPDYEARDMFSPEIERDRADVASMKRGGEGR